MNIFYNDNTLYVNLEERVDDYMMHKLRRRVFNIVDDYDIESVVLNLIANNKNDYLVEEFIKEYQQKYGGKIQVK